MNLYINEYKMINEISIYEFHLIILNVNVF